ncbi:hypothetical protein [Paenibacillus sp. 2TAB19]|uniref:hypothetical protein n=1 Tax=Paenibacillus sp. 2TAB19 TaxID=3233003 RepID=UPI003F991853
MAAKTENQSIEQLIKRFQELSSNTKQLDDTIASFSEVAASFQAAMEGLDQSHAFQELAKHSKDAIAKFEQLKSMNEQQVLGNLQTIVHEEVTIAVEKLQDHIEEEFMKRKEQGAGDSKRDEEIMELLRHMNQKLDLPPAAAASSSSDEMAQLKRQIAAINAKLKRQEDYERRIAMLELEVELLRGTIGITEDDNDSWPIDVSDDDLPF